MIYYLNCFFLYSLICECLHRNHPINFEDILWYASYYIIYVYSFFEMQIKVGIQYITNTDSDSDEQESEIEDDIEVNFVHQNIQTVFPINEINYETPYDFIIISKSKNNLILHKICYHKDDIKTIINDNKNDPFEMTDYLFILFDIEIDLQRFTIKLSNESYTYYLNNNIFNDKVYSFLLYKYHQIDLSKWTDMNTYNIELFDHNAVRETFSFNQKIHLMKDTYKIY